MRATCLVTTLVLLGACRASEQRVSAVEVRGPIELRLTFAAGAGALPEALASELTEGRLVLTSHAPRTLELSLPTAAELVVGAQAHVVVRGGPLGQVSLRTEGGAVDAALDADHLRVTGVGGSVVLSGRARVLELTLDGVAFDAAALQATVARVDLEGTARVRLTASERVSGAVRGGVLRVEGAPLLDVSNRGGVVETAPTTPWVDLGRAAVLRPPEG
jgi:Putative auto-transporter adhesin, head GIN domain